MLIDLIQQFTSLWEGGGYGNLMIQRIWTLDFQSYITANTGCEVVPRSRVSGVFRPYWTIPLLFGGGGCGSHRPGLRILISTCQQIYSRI
jgi:hypothetical protein